ncbi:uncharacterized protein LOC141890165 isoform X2 [Acropora palmata]|uniref:uncharacterized protein LOC141890165 isoform X2 n=1 Tax=Acropora palmata TaxID=6131 RepID=UPI003DA0F182
MQELEIEKEKMEEMLQQQRIQQSEQEGKIKRLCNMICSAGRKDSSEETVARRRLTWCPGVARSAAAVDCNRSDGGKRVGFVSPQAKRKREDREMQTEPDESINSLIDEIWSLRRHLGEAKTELETQRLKNRELQEELAALKGKSVKKKTSEGKGCGCSGKCRTRKCSCRNTQKTCSVDCDCQSPKCENRHSRTRPRQKTKRGRRQHTNCK